MDIREKLKEITTGKNAKTLLIIVGALIILLIFLSEMDLGSNKKTTDALADNTADEEYINKTEKQIKELVKNITGDDDANVAISLECGTEHVYATTKEAQTGVKKNGDGESGINETSDKSAESYIIINTGSGEQPLIVSEISPKLRGIAVVCRYGYDNTVRENLTSAIKTLLDIPESKISISGKG